MAIVKQSIDLLTGTHHVGAGAVSGQARGHITFGRGNKFGRIIKIELKGDDTDVDVNGTFTMVDAKGREVLTAFTIPGGDGAGGSDAVTLMTDQRAVIGKTVTAVSTFGVGYYLSVIETEILDSGGDFSANTEGGVAAPFAESPVLVTHLSGTDGDWHRVTLWVEV